LLLDYLTAELEERASRDGLLIEVGLVLAGLLTGCGRRTPERPDEVTREAVRLMAPFRGV